MSGRGRRNTDTENEIYILYRVEGREEARLLVGILRSATYEQLRARTQTGLQGV